MIHTQRLGHLPIFRRGTHQNTPARSLQQEPEESEHQRPEHDQQDIVLRQSAAGDGNGAFEARRAWPEQILWAPCRQRHVLDDQHDGECRDEL